MLKDVAMFVAFVGGYLVLGGSEPDYLNSTADTPPVYAESYADTRPAHFDAQELPAGRVTVTAVGIWADERREPLTADDTPVTVPATVPAEEPAPPGIMHHCPQWEAEALLQGWPADQLDRLDHIMWRESRCRPDAHNTADPTRYGSRGLLQINGFWVKHFGIDADSLFDPATNLRTGHLIYTISGWGPWTATDPGPTTDSALAVTD